MSPDEALDDIVTTRERVGFCAGYAEYAAGYLETRLGLHWTEVVVTLVWAATRFSHKLGISKVRLHQLVDEGWAYSVADDEGGLN